MGAVPNQQGLVSSPLSVVIAMYSMLSPTLAFPQLRQHRLGTVRRRIGGGTMAEALLGCWWSTMRST